MTDRNEKNKIQTGLKAALAFTEGDETQGRIIRCTNCGQAQNSRLDTELVEALREARGVMNIAFVTIKGRDTSMRERSVQDALHYVVDKIDAILRKREQP